MDQLPTPEPRTAAQPDGVAWPAPDWPIGELDERLQALVDNAFEDPQLATTYAALVVRDGEIVAERYGNALPSFVSEPIPVDERTPLLGFSMAKSVLHALVGLLVDEGRLDPDAPAPVPEWQPGDPRAAITLRELLEMRDGLDFCEDYVDERVSDTITMLFGDGRADMGGFAASKPLAAAPGTRFNYSSGTSNIIARIVADVVGRGDAMERFVRERLFEPIGMHDATIELDESGVFVGSTYVRASARSWARFGTLYLRGGAFDGRRILSESWVASAQRPTSLDETNEDDVDIFYSLHWWLDGAGVYWASGYEGQRVIVVPDANAVIVRIGSTGSDRYPVLRRWKDSVVAQLRAD